MTSEKKWDHFRASEKKEEKSRVTLIVHSMYPIFSEKLETFYGIYKRINDKAGNLT